MKTESERNTHRIIEEQTVGSDAIFDRIKELIREGNIRRLIIKTPNDRVLIEMPVTAGVFIGSVATILAPVVVVLAALTGIVTRMKIVVERDTTGQ